MSTRRPSPGGQPRAVVRVRDMIRVRVMIRVQGKDLGLALAFTFRA